ncbi:hypothetical protein E2320_014713 [Naja naja]|nr:hypothetical protein E2320_014713 [Naja naja]
MRSLQTSSLPLCSTIPKTPSSQAWAGWHLPVQRVSRSPPIPLIFLLLIVNGGENVQFTFVLRKCKLDVIQGVFFINEFLRALKTRVRKQEK